MQMLNHTSPVQRPVMWRTIDVAVLCSAGKLGIAFPQLSHLECNATIFTTSRYCTNSLQINIMELDGFDQYFLNGPIVTMSKHIHPYTLPPHKLGTVKLLLKTPVLPFFQYVYR